MNNRASIWILTLPLALFCSILAAEEQDSATSIDNTLPVHCDGLPAEIIKFIKTNGLEVFTTPNNPGYMKGNFDGTGEPDYALWLSTYQEEYQEEVAMLVVFWNGTASDTTVVDDYSKETDHDSKYELATDSLLAYYYNAHIEVYKYHHLELYTYYDSIPPPPYNYEGLFFEMTLEGGEKVGDYYNTQENGAYIYHNGKFYYLLYNVAF